MKNINEILIISKNIRVLYVEDNAEARESTLGLLSNIFTDIVVAIDGEEGLKKFTEDKQDYDLVISDINMPNMDGREMIKRIREIDTNIKIFVLSAYNEKETNVEEKVEAYLSKPIDFLKLFEEIEIYF